MKRMASLLLALLAVPAVAAGPGYADLSGGSFRSAIRFEENGGNVEVPAFSMMTRAVTRAQFQQFLQQHPQWRRDRVPTLFADGNYLSAWSAPEQPGADGDAPVTQVSWYAADAYCKAQGARLPTWLEWEYAAAADAERADARSDPAWRQRVLLDGTPHAVDAGAGARPNVHGVAGLHGTAWEWVEDFSSLMDGAEKRGGADGEKLQFCGAGALQFNDRGNYTVLKRIAILSAMRPANTLGNLGFRCARSLP